MELVTAVGVMVSVVGATNGRRRAGVWPMSGRAKIKELTPGPTRAGGGRDGAVGHSELAAYGRGPRSGKSEITCVRWPPTAQWGQGCTKLR
jgi:hypothetical protein